MKTIHNLFDNLDRWRNLPAYQLERRADIFFSIYLPEVLSQKFGVKVEAVIPEFPIRIGTIHDRIDVNKSFKVDYLARAEDGKTILLVELKTDQGSRRDKQDWYLERAKQVGMVEILEGLRKIVRATHSKRKYAYLLEMLHVAGLITLDDRGGFEVPQNNYEIQIVYIQPNNPAGQENVITFREVSQIVARHADDLSARFAQSLLKWAGTRAGDD
jgi:hypothetical protein